jgi:hypothetical protein
MTRPDTPFPRHWLYYIVLKYGVIFLGVMVAIFVLWRLVGGAT